MIVNTAELLQQQFAPVGTRIHKAYERRLQQRGFMDASEYTVPGKDAPESKYGGIQPSVLNRALRDIGALPAARTKARRTRGMPAGKAFWSDGKKGLAKGIWLKAGTQLRCLLLVVRGVRYRPRVDLKATAERVVRERFQRNFDDALRQALATAR